MNIIAKKRKSLGLTQFDLAVKAGLHPVKIAQLEGGRIKPENIRLTTAIKLSAALNCTAGELLSGIDADGDTPVD